MATSESHKLGEFLGTFFENLMKKPVRKWAEQNGLYFDSYGDRESRSGKKVTWTDIHGSKHDLDFVIEKGGTDQQTGTPIAFIELAWRRYTKHSKNKAQEIAGAVDPICERFSLSQPFKGAILSGDFTKNALNQLKNDGFHVLYIPFNKFVKAFAAYGFDVYFDEDTSEADFKKKNDAITAPGNAALLEMVKAEFPRLFDAEIKQFVSELNSAYFRKIKSIIVLPLYGIRSEVDNIASAIDLIAQDCGQPADATLQYLELILAYNDGSHVQARFSSKDAAIDFLKRNS